MESIVVQFVYVSADRGTSDFRFFYLGSEKFSGAVSAPASLLGLYLDQAKIAMRPNSEKMKPEELDAVVVSPTQISSKTSLVKVIVWTSNSRQDIEQYMENIAIAEETIQPKKSFWVVDLEENTVLLRKSKVSEAIVGYQDLMKGFGFTGGDDWVIS